MNDAVLDTLFYPLTQGLVSSNLESAACAFLNAQTCPALETLQAGSLFLQQYFKPYARALQERGLNVASEIPAGGESYDLVFIALPKNVIEARFLSAQGLRLLKPGGLLLCAAHNKAGGARIQKMLQEFGLKNVQHFSKNKARVCWAQKGEALNGGALNETAQKALADGGQQTVMAGGYSSIPGIFGWDKIDRGSAMLAQHLPDNFYGAGADFGCGYGYLSRHILQHCPGVNSLSCIDADIRAVKLCQENLSGGHGARIRYFWEDLTQPLTGLRDLDFIVMNPPFHEGKKTDTALGTAFIKTACYSLKPGGQLWMVANANLPYEEVLAASFSHFETLTEDSGFKIFCAVK